MKLFSLTTAAFLCAITLSAQNTQTETKIKTTTIKDSEGVHKTVKKEVVTKVQKIELGKENPNSINIPTVASPVTVTTETKITNPDGTTRTVSTDRSAYYSFNGKIYKLELDALGYQITQGEMKALLRKTSTNSFIYKSNQKTAIGYFDLEGNLVLEFYNDQLDVVDIEKYLLLAKNQ